MECGVSDEGHVFGSAASPETRLFLPEGDVEHPAQTVSMAQWARAAAVKAWAVRRRDEM